MRTSRLLLQFVAAGACVLVGSVAPAQEFPSRTIRIIVPNTPGTIHDLGARIMGPEMSKLLGQPVIVENKPGSNGLLGYEYVAKQLPADGYAVVSTFVGDLAILPWLFKDLRFDPLRDLPAILGLAEGRWFFGSPSQAPWKSFVEMVAHTRANPGKLNYGASNTSTRLLTESITRELGLDIVHIPYTGGGPYIAALSANEIQLGFVSESAAATFGDRFRVLAMTGEQRLARHPNIPTFAELGHPQIRGLSLSLNVAAGTPRSAFDKLSAAASRALQPPEVKGYFEKIRWEIIDRSPEASAKVLADEAKVYADIAKRAGIRPQ